MRNLLDWKLVGWSILLLGLAIVFGFDTYYKDCESCKPCGWMITVGMSFGSLILIIFIIFARIFREKS